MGWRNSCRRWATCCTATASQRADGYKRLASSSEPLGSITLYQDPHESDPRLLLHYGDLTDSINLIRIIQQVQPDEIYNLDARAMWR